MKKVETSPEKCMDLIGQCPVVIVSCRKGGLNLGMPVAWIMGSNYEPPKMAMTLGAWNSSFEPLLASGECVINITSEENAKTIFEFGGCHSEGKLDKFEKFGVAWTSATLVAGAIIDECFASLECRVEKAVPEYGLFILRCERYWLAADYSPEKYHLLHSLGEVLYTDEGKKLAKVDLL